MAGLVGDGEYYDGSSEGTESDPTPIFHEIRSVSYSDKVNLVAMLCANFPVQRK